jgi:hypothetical protein
MIGSGFRVQRFWITGFASMASVFALSSFAGHVSWLPEVLGSGLYDLTTQAGQTGKYGDNSIFGHFVGFS